MQITLNAIRSHEPCSDGWAKLLKHLGKTGPDDEPLPIFTVLDSNGLDDALWCLRAVSGHDREIRLFAVWCARQVEHLNTDPRIKACNDVAERFANGEASHDELSAVRDAARAAAWDAWAAARDAGAARAAARAAGDAAWDARDAWAAAWAARDARDAAGDAGDAQEKELRRILAKVAT
tara:strand:+ start:2756 stop:3292 length:537 start_codon:yes stop_codon:yes gene_type:complete